ncbi:hypothetical protein J7E63_11485, partial [Bacillus sp. ISL-75]|nr:hypothetical protein [Bacillus sp. ISL-75]
MEKQNPYSEAETGLFNLSTKRVGLPALRLSRKSIFLGNFLFSAFNYSLYLLMGLLISAPGTSLSAGVPGSLLVATLLRGLP